MSKKNRNELSEGIFQLSNSQIQLKTTGVGSLLELKISRTEELLQISFPTFEIGGKAEPLNVVYWQELNTPVLLRNGVTEYSLHGETQLSGVSLNLLLRVAEDSPVVRLKFIVTSLSSIRLTKVIGKDRLNYFTASFPAVIVAKEIRFSEFNEKAHATHRTEALLSDKMFEHELTAMGPLIIASDASSAFLIAYEHGSQYPDRFLEFQLHTNKTITLRAVKSNYLDNQVIDREHPFESIWFQIAAIEGDEASMAKAYRHFVLHRFAENTESRKPYIFYNTWGRQEAVKWGGSTYLATMRLDYTLAEIDRAHALGIEVYVIDTGWYQKAGDWKVNMEFFPDGLQEVKARLHRYGMKLGLWFNPTAAALSSEMLKRNMENRVMLNGKYPAPLEIWETENAIGLCMVSDYWNDFAYELIRVIHETGVTYFKWDAIWQYACSAPGHHHGDALQTEAERLNSYAFQLPIFMGKVITEVSKHCPEAIFDFDITEDGRSVGLDFLAHGKYFIINNGPYFHNLDVCADWSSPTADGNPNILVNPGAARGWYTRSVLDYDKWFPSVLFLTHYLPNGPQWSQKQNIASLLLGQNGIWGEINSMDEDGVNLFDHYISIYKEVRDDITAVSLKMTGNQGDSHEIYEKINPATGKGMIVLFANQKGTYFYVSKSKVNGVVLADEGLNITVDANGYAIIKAVCDKSKAKIVFFGAQK